MKKMLNLEMTVRLPDDFKGTMPDAIRLFADYMENLNPKDNEGPSWPENEDDGANITITEFYQSRFDYLWDNTSITFTGRCCLAELEDDNQFVTKDKIE